MLNFRKILATSVLALAFSLTAYGLDGWMSTGSKPTPTPQPPAPTATTNESEAVTSPTDEEFNLLDAAFKVSFSILQNALTLL